MDRTSNSKTPVVIVVGAGFGGLNVVRSLKRAPVRVILIDKRNYHLFQPLLYQVATAGLAPGQIAQPIRSLVRDVSNCEVYLDEVVDVDPQQKTVSCNRRVFRYDYLVIATGASPNYFGKAEWQTHAPSLKSLFDATEVRKNILRAFELAESEENELERRKLLNFVVIGAGPTGVEVAGAINELAKVTLRRDFRNIDPTNANVYLVEAGTRILSGFDPGLSAQAKKKLEKLGITVLTNHRVESLGADCAVLSNGTRVEARTIVWAAGVKSEGPSRWLNFKAASDGRIDVDAKLRSTHHENTFIIGDAAKAKDPVSGQAYPGIAPVAIQQGEFVGKFLKQTVLAKECEHMSFAYRDKGMLATIGRSYAVGSIGSFKFKGVGAWMLWSLVHVIYLVGFRNRILVLTDWIWSYLTYQKGSRLIVEGAQKPNESHVS